MRHLTCFSAFAIVVLAGCRETTVPPTPPLQALISDGAHAGNPHFFFLPPLVPNPTTTGQFNPRLAPVVEVCRLAGNPLVGSVDCADLNSDGKPDLVFGPTRMSVDPSNQQYQLNWDTKSSTLDATAFYRIFVRGAAGGTALGFLDVDPVLGGMKNAKTGSVFVFQDGRTLPIKVRIEQGAFGGGTNTTDFVEQTVPNIIPGGALDVTTNTKNAGARFTSGWLSFVNAPALDQVTVIIQRVPITGRTTCLNTPLDQLEGCYQFRTDPDLHTLIPGIDLKFAAKVIAGVCFQYPADIGQPGARPFELYRSQETGEGLAPAQPLLSEEAAPFLDCGSFGPTQPPPTTIGAALRSGRFDDIAKAGLFALTRALGRVVQPAALRAVDLGAGGSTDGFSHFGYVRPATMTVSPDGATAPAGSTVGEYALVQTVHDDKSDEEPEISPVVGQPVTFTVTAGGGTLSATENDKTVCNEVTVCTVKSDEEGFANVSWRLGVGDNHVDVTTGAVSNGSQSIQATGSATTFQATFTGDQTDAPPQVPDIGTWELVDPTDGTVLVRSAVADLTNKPVEIANEGEVAGTPVLHGLAAGIPPTTGTWVVRWRSVMSSASESGWSTGVVVLSGGLPASTIAIISYLPGGQLNYGNSFSTDDQVATWTLGQSQSFELTIDLDAKLVRSLAIDGEVVITDQPFIESAAANVGRIRIGGGGTTPNTLGWDDISISAQQAPVVTVNRAH